MARDMTPAMETAIAAETGTLVHFIEIILDGSTIRLTTASQDISWDGETWNAVGGAIAFGGVQESGMAESGGHGAEMVLSGEDGSIINAILTNHLRGRTVVIYYGHADAEAGTVIADPLEIFRGYLNDQIRVTDSRKGGAKGGGKITVRTNLTSRLAELEKGNPIRTNLHSHRDLARRAGLPTNDTFFTNLPKLAAEVQHRADKIYWGREGPSWTGRTAKPRD